MDWVSELRQAFRRLADGSAPPVSFAGRPDTIGEVGREFNALAAVLNRSAGELTREQAHNLRNRLAGILAALHVLGAAGGLDNGQQTVLRDVMEEAKRLDGGLRARPAEKR